MSTPFVCPLCGGPFARTDRALRCQKGHSFDISAAGYVHLMPANRLHAKNPGDDAGMVAARAEFLSAGWYAPLREALAARIAADLPKNGTLLDAGCGEGKYTCDVLNAVKAAGKTADILGIDISKDALMAAFVRRRS